MWKEKYRVGVEVIDQQHEELFRRVADFLNSVQRVGSWDDKLAKVKETLEFMQEYVVVHFEAEEALQREINYPDYEAHKKAHEDLKGTVADYASIFEQEGYLQETVQEFGAKLMTWLIMHVAATDQKIGEYLREQGGVNHEG